MSSVKLNQKDYFDKVKQELIKETKCNPFAVPSLDYISLNVGMGKYSPADQKEILDNLEKLTGQKPQSVSAKKSIANFKTRQGQQIATRVTLRKDKARDFLMQLINIALPRTRDFKGVTSTKNSGFDTNYKSCSVGIPLASIFPAIGFTSKVNFGIQVNIVFQNPDKNNKLFLEKLKFPFKK